jgi:hypothetical protein
MMEANKQLLENRHFGKIISGNPLNLGKQN